MFKYLLITRIIGLLLFFHDIFINEDKKINLKKAMANKKNKMLLNGVLISYFFFNVILAEFEIISVLLNIIYFLLQTVLKIIKKIGTLYFDYYEFQRKFENKLLKKLLKKYGDENGR